MRILVTGSEGLIGSHLCQELATVGWTVKRFDIRRSPIEDIRSISAVRQATQDVDGVIHLAAVSRVIWAEEDPLKCEQVNIGAIKNLVTLLAERQAPKPPWLLFASSREVYGQQTDLPVPETASLRPMNTYARSKVEGEAIVLGARSCQLKTNVVRLSSVYGSTNDHPTRVTPAFARASANGGEIRIEGHDNTFDFVHVLDVVQGIMKFVALSRDGVEVEPIHLCSGRGTSLSELGTLAAKFSDRKIKSRSEPPRDFDVRSFVGCTRRARKKLGWESTTALQVGFDKLVREFRIQAK